MNAVGTRQLPESLPARLYLLAYDTRRGRLTQRHQLGYALRAAALADLHLRGLLGERDGRVAQGRRVLVDDPVLAVLLDEVLGARARTWGAWVRRRPRATLLTVQIQLENERFLRVEHRRVLGIFPVDRVTLRDPLAVDRLTALVTRTLDGTVTDPRDAALVALAAEAGLGTVFPWRRRRLYGRRLTELTEQSGPVLKLLRKALAAQRAVEASAA